MTAVITETHIQRHRLKAVGSKESGRLFLVTGGPTLELMNLGMLIGETSWATGRIAYIYDRTFWRPSRYWAGAYPKTAEAKKELLLHLNEGYDCWVRSDIAAHLSLRDDNLTIWQDTPVRGFAVLKYHPHRELRTILQEALLSDYDPVVMVSFDGQSKVLDVAYEEFKSTGKELLQLAPPLLPPNPSRIGLGDTIGTGRPSGGGS